MLGNLKAYSLRSLSVVGTQVHVDESPIALVRNLRAEPIDLVVAPRDADDLRSEHIRTQNLRRLQVGRDKYPSLESLSRRMCRHGIRQIPGRRTRDSIESKLARLRQCHRNHAILEAQRRQADGIVLDVKILGERTQALSKMRRLEQRREPYWQSWFKALGEGQKLSVAPHVRGPLGNALASE